MGRRLDSAAGPLSRCASPKGAGTPLASERIPQTHLKDARVVRPCDPSEERGTEADGRIAEIHAVERVEHLEAVLQLVLIRVRHREGLEQRRVEIGVAGPLADVATQQSESPDGVGLERGGIEELRDLVAARAVTGEADWTRDVRPVVADPTERSIDAGEEVQRRSRLQDDDTVELPTAQ